MSAEAASVVLVYFAAVMLTGYLSARRVRTVEDYYVGGRAIGGWLTALSFGTVYFSAVIFTVAGAWQWIYGLPMAFRDSWGTALLGTALCFLVLGPRLRAQSKKLRALTVPDYFEYRYGSKLAKIATTAVVVYSMFIYATSLFVGMAIQTETVLDIPYELGLAICALVVVFYTALGGYIGAVWTQAIQAVVMVVVTIYIGILGVSLVGGMDSMIEALYKIRPSMTGWPWDEPWIYLATLLVIGFLPWGNAAAITRFYGVKHSSAFRWAMLIAVLFSFAITFPINLAGTAARILFPALERPDAAIPLLVAEYSPPAISGLFLAGVYAASMSTAAVQIFIVANALVKDVAATFMWKKSSEREVLKWTKIATVVVGALVVLSALRPPKLLADLWGTSASVVASSLVGPLVLSLYWPRATDKGVAAGSIVSWLSTIAYCAIKEFKWPHTFEAWYPSIALSFLVTIVVSLLTRPPPQERLRELGFSSRGA